MDSAVDRLLLKLARVRVHGYVRADGTRVEPYMRGIGLPAYLKFTEPEAIADLASGTFWEMKVQGLPEEGSIASMSWTDPSPAAVSYGQVPQIHNIYVAQGYRRMGIGTELLRRARKVTPKLQHSDKLSALGKLFARAAA